MGKDYDPKANKPLKNGKKSLLDESPEIKENQ